MRRGDLLERAVAYFIDHFLVGIVGPMTMAIVIRALMSAGLYGIVSLAIPHVEALPMDVILLWRSYSWFERMRVIAAIAMLPRWVYMTLFIGSRWHATPGKMLFRLKVVRTNGQPIGYMTAALRSFSRGLLFAVSLGLSGFVNLILIWRRQKRQALHDLIADSEVIHLR